MIERNQAPNIEGKSIRITSILGAGLNGVSYHVAAPSLSQQGRREPRTGREMASNLPAGGMPVPLLSPAQRTY